VRRLGLDDLDLAGILLDDGLIVAVPTDTVYGLAARLDDPLALDALYLAKGRPETKPLPVLVADPAAAVDLLGELPAELEALVERHWPGALTIVAPCDAPLAARVRSTDQTVGIRCPDDPTTRALLRITGPLCVTSANRSGEEPCRSADEVIATLSSTEAVAAVLDAGRRDGVPSTVVAVRRGGIDVLRQGPVTL
jgi:L-threonylcarbamoyladenylate synthase